MKIDILGIRKNLEQANANVAAALDTATAAINSANNTWQDTAAKVNDTITDVKATCADVRKKAKILVWLDAIKTCGVALTAAAAIGILYEMRK